MLSQSEVMCWLQGTGQHEEAGGKAASRRRRCSRMQLCCIHEIRSSGECSFSSTALTGFRMEILRDQGRLFPQWIGGSNAPRIYHSSTTIMSELNCGSQIIKTYLYGVKWRAHMCFDETMRAPRRVETILAPKGWRSRALHGGAVVDEMHAWTDERGWGASSECMLRRTASRSGRHSSSGLIFGVSEGERMGGSCPG